MKMDDERTNLTNFSFQIPPFFLKRGDDAPRVTSNDEVRIGSTLRPTSRKLCAGKREERLKLEPDRRDIVYGVAR